MPAISRCPDLSVLKQLALGELNPDEIGQLQNHLDECADCLRALEALPTDDALVQAVQASPARPHPEADAVERLMQRLRDSGPFVARLARTETLVHHSKSDTPAELGPESFDFLLAPTDAGELGWLGGYRVLRVLGSGGMGIVFEAEDPKLQRPVALKVMRPSIATRPGAGERFLREARATAAIQHDHIVTIHQVGEDRGVPYFAMQLLQGETLETRLERDARRSIAEVVRLGREIAKGLAAAHARGLIHRDIKPANIWIESGGDGQLGSYRERVKLLDFGLARAAEESLTATQPGVIAGTPAYMAPEQASDGPIDHRCDLFSLGCVLYRMCTGELPFKGEKPVTILWSLAVKQPPSPRQLNPQVPAQLSDLIMRLLAKDPSQRPQSARAVADELGAINLVPPKPSRRRAGRIVAGAIAALLLGGTTLYAPSIYRFATNRGRVTLDTADAGTSVVIRRDGVEVATLDATRRDVTLKGGAYQVELATSNVDLEVSPPELMVNRDGQHSLEVRTKPPGALHVFAGHEDIVWAAEFCLDGTHVVSASGNRFVPATGRWLPGSDYSVRLWDARTGREVRQFKGHTELVRCLAVSPDGKRVVSAGGTHRNDRGKDFALRLWDLETGRLVREFKGHTNSVASVAFAPDGKRVASASYDMTARLWDVESGNEVGRFEQDEKLALHNIDISRDGKLLLTGNKQGMLRLWNVATGSLKSTFRAGGMEMGTASFAPDGRFCLTTPMQRLAWLWDLEKQQPIRKLDSLWGWMGHGSISHDGRRVLTCGEDTLVHLWDVETQKELMRFAGHVGPVASAAFSPDGRRAVSAGWDNTVRLWKLPD